MTVSCALPFTTNVTISTSISQTFGSWVAILHLRQHIVFYLTHRSYGMPGLAPLMILFILRAAQLSSKLLRQGYVMERSIVHESFHLILYAFVYRNMLLCRRGRLYPLLYSKTHIPKVRQVEDLGLFYRCVHPGHLVSPLVFRGPWMSTVVLYCWCHNDGASVLLYFTFRNILKISVLANVGWHRISRFHFHSNRILTYFNQ